MPETPPAQSASEPIPVGSEWKCKTGRWRVIAANYDGAGTYRVERVNPDGTPSQLYDTVWGAEILMEAERVL